MNEGRENNTIPAKTEPEEALVITPARIEAKFRSELIVVPLMLIASSTIMAAAWLGHLKFKEEIDFLLATALSWLLVLPEYALNISAIRTGHPTFTGGQMAAFRLCSGVVCVALISRFFLGEPMTVLKLLGFAVMMVAMVMIADPKKDESPLERGL